MTYQETLDYMFNSLPAYHLVGKAAYKADLSNTELMMDHLGHPEKELRCIHVAGTNGKGSVSHFLASILQQSGLRVGLYTSPHLVDFRERIRINGVMIPENDVVDFIETNKPFFQANALSFFEMTVGLAFDYFASQQVDIAVVEVGLGGRLDATNVINPILSIITNIGFDHTQFLGNTLAEIAGEKAGIIKPGIPVVIGETHPETKAVFIEKAQSVEAPILFADQHYQILQQDNSAIRMQFRITKEGKPYLSPMESPMAGSYQLKNIATLMQAIEVLQSKGLSISEKNIRLGIAQVITSTGLHGRWECFGENPLLVCETAHNEDGVREMLAKLQQIEADEIHFIYGCVSDKDFRHILSHITQTLQGRKIHYYFTQPSVPRRLDVSILSQTAQELGILFSSYNSVSEAIAASRLQAKPTDMILVTGSIFLVADAVQYLRQVSN